MCKRLINQQGYTLAEYLVSLSLMVFIMVILFALVNGASLRAAVEQSNSNLHYSASSAMQYMRTDALGAENVEVLGEGKIMRLTDPAGAEVRYYVENGQLYRRRGDLKQPVAENAGSVVFQMVSPGLVEVVFEARDAHSSYYLQSAFKVRKHI